MSDTTKTQEVRKCLSCSSFRDKKEMIRNYTPQEKTEHHQMYKELRHCSAYLPKESNERMQSVFVRVCSQLSSVGRNQKEFYDTFVLLYQHKQKKVPVI